MENSHNKNFGEEDERKNKSLGDTRKQDNSEGNDNFDDNENDSNSGDDDGNLIMKLFHFKLNFLKCSFKQSSNL